MLHGVVSYVPNRVDGDHSVQSAVINKLIQAGARVSKQLGSTTTHVVFLQKLLPSFQEQVQQEEIIKDLYERIAKVVATFMLRAQPTQRSTPGPAGSQPCIFCTHPCRCCLCRQIAGPTLCPTFGFMLQRSRAQRQM